MRSRRGRFLLLTVLLAGCGGGGGGGGADGGGGGAGGFPTGSVSGRVQFVRQPRGPFLEVEPNDSVDRAHDLGDVRVGDAFTVLGHARASDDAFDGFRFRAPGRVNVVVRLQFDDRPGNDVEVAVHDPIGLQFVETFEAASSPAAVGFYAKGPFDVVVRTLSGETDWTMVVQAGAPGNPVGEREPNDGPAQAQYLGEVVEGDVVALRGTLSSPSDAADTFVLACPEAIRVAATLSMPAFQDFDLDLLDGTADLTSPVPLASFSAGTSPEGGVLDVAAGTLLVVRASAVSGAGAYDLGLSGVAVPAADASTAVQAASRVVPGWRRSAPGGVAGPYGTPRDALVAGEAIVRAVPGREAELAARLARRGGRVLETSPSGVVRVAFDVPPDLDEDDAARLTIARVRGLSGASALAYAEPNQRVFATDVPDDAYYGHQWHYRMIHLPEAWDLVTGSPDVVVAVLDTGRTNHPDLAGRQSGGYDFISIPSIARDGNGRDPDPTDPGDLAYGGSSSFHGTHVAGTIGAATDNATGVAGVTWAAQIMHLRVLGRGGGTIADIVEAVRYAAALPNASGTVPPVRADVINMSLGGGGYSQAMQDAVNAARAAGVVVFAAAGNSNTSQPGYPASLAGVVSVIAVNSAKGRAWYSNFGSTCDLSAPGGDTGLDLDQDGLGDGVLSTVYDDSVSPAQAAYSLAQGTSMACPHAAGVAALLRAANPAMTPDEVEQILFSTAEDLGAPGRDDTFGHGLVDAFAAVAQAMGGVPTAPPRLSLFPTSVVFSGATTVTEVSIGNVGGGTLNVSAATPSTSSGGDWLSATLVGPGDASRSARAVSLAVDRSGLAVGTYAGTVTVESDGGTEEIPVALETGIVPPPLPDIDIRVLAVRVDTGEVVQQAMVNPTQSLEWSFPVLPAGEYVFLASTDVDRDGGTCEDGDWCGAFPLASDPEPVLVLANTHVPDVDFRVAVTRTLED